MKTNQKVSFEGIPKTIEEFISVKHGCIGLIDSYRFLSSSLCSPVKTLVDNKHKTLMNLKNEFGGDDKTGETRNARTDNFR